MHLPLTLPHSKSLDHYVDQQHRHHHCLYQANYNHGRYASFDHQYYENNRATKCDCSDGYHKPCVPKNNFYNIPGSRCSLPYSLSNHMLGNVSVPSSNNQLPSSCNNCNKINMSSAKNDFACTSGAYHNVDPYCHECGGNITQHAALPAPQSSSLSTTHLTVQHQLKNNNTTANNCFNSAKNGRYSNNTINDRLIEFDERPNTDIYMNNSKLDYYDKQYSLTNDANRRMAAIDVYPFTHNQQQPPIQLEQSSDNPDTTYAKCVKSHSDVTGVCTTINKKCPSVVERGANVHLYSTNTNGKRSLSFKNYIEKYNENPELFSDYEDLHINNGGDSYNSRESNLNSYEDISNEYSTEPAASNTNNSYSPKTISNKNQDGVGSYEYWNFVYKLLERDGYNKDRGDLYVRGLDLNPVPDVNAEKAILWDEDRHNNDDYEQKINHYKNDDLLKCKSENYVLHDIAIKPPVEYDNTIILSDLKNTGNKNCFSLSNGNNSSKAKSAANDCMPLSHLENCQAVDAERRQVEQQQLRQQQDIRQQQQKSIVNRQLTGKQKESRMKNQPNNTQKTVSISGNFKENGALTHKTTAVTKSSNSRHSFSALVDTTVETTNNTNQNEWACKFCTFLNSQSKRICEMCSKSKDFNLDAPNKSTATCI